MKTIAEPGGGMTCVTTAYALAQRGFATTLRATQAGDQPLGDRALARGRHVRICDLMQRSLDFPTH
ncbi:hypothetical protein [Massilia genomosp. 1]|uniref:Uncharacterized protein n=1 Tax=Massilia genomosp. 1 TaxID=2609280 RepID=A0ABX0N018_9BURK|nr:hypothetical protein [Massilia genomosp. 1]NHZ66370.1 hypothetical protein [Massilia genomosp. 1]